MRFHDKTVRFYDRTGRFYGRTVRLDGKTGQFHGGTGRSDDRTMRFRDRTRRVKRGTVRLDNATSTRSLTKFRAGLGNVRRIENGGDDTDPFRARRAHGGERQNPGSSGRPFDNRDDGY